MSAPGRLQKLFEIPATGSNRYYSVIGDMGAIGHGVE